MVDKYWISFNDLSVECICHFGDKKCRSVEIPPDCKLYVCKFIDITSEFEIDNTSKNIEKALKELDIQLDLQHKITKQFKKNQIELQNSLKKFKI